MSLESLRAMRRERVKPALVTVIVGAPPRWLEDDADTVVIRPGAAPLQLDLRALVGLAVVVIELARDDTLLERTLDAVEQAKAKVLGVVGSAGVAGASPEAERLLVRYRELLWQA